MHLITQKNLSSYLVKPNVTARQIRHWSGFNTPHFTVKRSTAHSAAKSLAALAIWCMGYAAISSAIEHPKLNAKKVISDSVSVSKPQVVSSQPDIAQLASIQSLPIDPTGQMLPPIPTAPDYTYPNTYDWGQCTWYVAGRRNVPNDWGNANTWYERAADSGWQVGSVPAVGAIAWTDAGYYGHVALVEEISTDYQYVQVSEMNYDGLGEKDTRWVSSSSFKYIYN
jgi:surface antigen